MSVLVNEGIFTPISTKSTLQYPGSVGGVNWGSPAFDPHTGILYANTNSLAFNIRLVPRSHATNDIEDRILRKAEKWMAYFTPESEKPAEQRFRAPDGAGQQLNAQSGTPYQLFVEPLLSPDGLPCTPPPWGHIVALNLNSGKLLWAQPLGTMIPGLHTGSVSLGGPIVTAGGLIFSAATVEPYLRALDLNNGSVLWRGSIPNPAQATPMTYKVENRQFVIICSGGSAFAGGPLGDSVVAFALPESSPHGRIDQNIR
jgi:quinoprotein glucose dehydrogenase